MNDKSFSQRSGFSQAPEVQVQSMSSELRNGLWNVWLSRVFGKLGCNSNGDITQEYHIFIALQKHFFKLPMDELDRQLASRREWYKDSFVTAEWWQIYDLFEFVAKRMIPYDLQEFERDTNEVLARENAGYRLVGGSLVPSQDEILTEAVKATLAQLRTVRDLDDMSKSEEALKAGLAALALRPMADVQTAAKKSREAVSYVLAHLAGASGKQAAKDEPWEVLSSPELGLPQWLSGALAAAFGGDPRTDVPAVSLRPPADIAEAWVLVSLACTAVRLLVVRAMACGWVPQREVAPPEPTPPDPWGERHIVKNR
jgi:hypothetical protein